MNIFILMNGCGGNSIAEAAFKTKKALKQYIKKEYPDAKGTNRVEKDELYWELDGEYFNVEEVELIQ
jgi:hypothetical protein